MASNITKAFKEKARLRLRMADGGFIVGPGGVRPVTDDQMSKGIITRGVVEPEPSLSRPPVTATGMATSFIKNSMPDMSRVTTPILDTIAPMPEPDLRGTAATNMSRVVPNTGEPIRTSSPTIGVRAADGGSREDIMKRQGLRGAMRHGEVRGPGGPRDDKVPAMLSNGEYVIPADVVKKVGKENLDVLVSEHHEYTGEPTLRNGMADGGYAGTLYDLRKRGTAQWQPVNEPVASPAQQPAFTRSPITNVAGVEPVVSPRTPDAALNLRSSADFVEPSVRQPAPGYQPYQPKVAPQSERIAAPGEGVKSAFSTMRKAVGDAASAYRDFGSRHAWAPIFGALEGITGSETGELPGLRVANQVSGVAPVGAQRSVANQPPPNNAIRAAAMQGGDAEVAPTLRDTGLTTTRSGNNVTITGDGGPVPRAMQTIEGRRAQLRAAYAPTQYSETPSLRRDDVGGGFGRPVPASLGQAVDEHVYNRRGERAEAIAQRDREAAMRSRDANRSVDATLRGQDMSAGTALTTAQIKAQQDAADNARKQANADRDYALNQRRFGSELKEKDRAATAASEKAITESLESRFRTVNDKNENVPDHGKIAAFKTSFVATMPTLIQRLESTGKPEALAKAAAMRQRGMAALEPGDFDDLQQLFDQRERMRAAKGIGPNAGEFVESDDLTAYEQAGVEKRLFGGDRVVTRGGGSVSMNDLRYKEGPANAFWPDFKTETKNLTRNIRKEK